MSNFEKKNNMAEIADSIDNVKNRVFERGANLKEQVGDEVKNHPYRSLGITFLVGLLVGKFL